MLRLIVFILIKFLLRMLLPGFILLREMSSSSIIIGLRVTLIIISFEVWYWIVILRRQFPLIIDVFVTSRVWSHKDHSVLDIALVVVRLLQVIHEVCLYLSIFENSILCLNFCIFVEIFSIYLYVFWDLWCWGFI